MINQNHYTSLAQGKILSDLGLSAKKTTHVWRINFGMAIGPVVKDEGTRYELASSILTTFDKEFLIPAMNMEELWLVVPEDTTLTKLRSEGMYIAYVNSNPDHPSTAATGVEALAKLVIYLIKSGKITAERFDVLKP